MKLFYSASTKGFYNDLIHKEIPGDAIEVTHDEHLALLDGQTKGKVIAVSNGKVGLIDRPIITPTSEQIAESVQSARQTAYTQESDPIFFKYQRGEATKEDWLAKVEEIKTRYPDGKMPQ